METSYKLVLDLIGHIYDAAIDPAHWPMVLERVAGLTRSQSAVLVVHDRELRQVNTLYAYGLSKVLKSYLNSPFGKLDPALKIMREQPQGKAVNMYRLDDPARVPRLIQALLPRFTDSFYFGGVNCFNDGTWHAGIGLHRSRDVGEFEQETLELLEDLVPHFQRALRIQKEFTRLRLNQQMLQLELDRHVMGVILLNGDQQPQYINPMAKRILARHGAIGLRNNALRAYSRDEDAQLQQAVRDAATALPNTINTGKAFGLTHPEHPTPLALLVVPSGSGRLAVPLPDDRPKAQVAVYITDPEASAPIDDDSLMDIYDLTRREARVAVAMANGYELSQIAEMDNVSIQTVRSQLKSIFRKTGVNRQVDLIRLLLGGPLMFRG